MKVTIRQFLDAAGPVFIHRNFVKAVCHKTGELDTIPKGDGIDPNWFLGKTALHCEGVIYYIDPNEELEFVNSQLVVNAYVQETGKDGYQRKTIWIDAFGQKYLTEAELLASVERNAKVIANG